MISNHEKPNFSILLYLLYGLIGCATLLFFALLISGVVIFSKINDYFAKKPSTAAEYFFPNESQLPFDDKYFYDFDSDFFDDSFTQPFDNDSSSSDYPPVNLT